MYGVAIFSGIFFLCGILMKLLKNFKSILTGYGWGRIKTPKHLREVHNLAGNITITFSILFFCIEWLLFSFTSYSLRGWYSALIILLYTTIIYIMVQIKLNKIDDEMNS